MIKKKADKQAELKTRALLQLDKSMKFEDHVHPVKFKKGQYYIEISINAINNECYKNINKLVTNGTRQLILFKCKNYSNYDLAELIKEVNKKETIPEKIETVNEEVINEEEVNNEKINKPVKEKKKLYDVQTNTSKDSIDDNQPQKIMRDYSYIK